MCGIAGLLDLSRLGHHSDLARRAGAMAEAIAYRGPDGAATCGAMPNAALRWSHRRLAIVDLTPTGAQPMVSADGRWVISYNGEVYNTEAIAASPALAGLTRRGTSDTEVILELDRRGAASISRSTISTACLRWPCGIGPTETLHLVSRSSRHQATVLCAKNSAFISLPS